MKYHQLTRLFVITPIEKNNLVINEQADVHYLLKVMRKKIGDKFIIFNNQSGEFLVEISEVSGKFILVNILEQLRSKDKEREVSLIFAPIKQTRINFLLEKATELGVTKLLPITTEHSVVDKINMNKWKIYIKEAAEQCGRISVPEIFPVTSLRILLDSWQNDIILWCNEREKEQHFMDFTGRDNYTILIGPEGGFSSKEFEMLSAKNFVKSVHLGQRTLRSETAVIAALAYASL